MDPLIEFLVSVDADDADQADIEELTRGLRQELLTLDVEDVVPMATEEAPPGSKAGDPVALTLGVSVLSTATPAVIALIHTWALSRRRPCTVRIQGPEGAAMEIPGIPLQEARDMLERWAGDRPGD